jgi:diguanylate cyclase (GGDEF)-like protein
MKKSLFLILFLFFPLFLFSVEKKVYKVVIPKDWKPYYFINENGKPDGYGVELFEAVAKNLDLKYEYVVVDDFEKILKLFEEKKVDIIPNIGITQRREKIFLFTQPTDSFFIKIYKRENQNDILKLDDLVNKKIGLVEENICSKLIDKKVLMEKKFYNHYEDLVNALENKEIDVFCYPEALISKKIEGKDIIPLEKALKEIKRGFGLAKHDFNLLPYLNDSITELKLSGELQNIYNKWFSHKSYISLTKSEMIFLVISFFGITFTSFVIMFYFLSKKKWLLTKDMLIKEVNKRTYILQIQNKRLKKIHQKLKEQSNIDPLTKIYNRKFYNEKISELLSSYKRYKQPFSYMIFDIDDFKKINDTYGHDIGDEVLKQLTKAISNHIRANDYFFRVGGEEFVILFSDTNLHQSLDVANKIKDLIFTDIDLIENRITISVGLTQIDETDSVETIYKRADSLLYEAKHNGKNQVKYN